MEAFEENTNDSRINVHYKIDEPDVDIVFDIDKTERILLNLYSNAVKYSKPESSIFIAAGIKIGEGDEKENFNKMKLLKKNIKDAAKDFRTEQ